MYVAALSELVRKTPKTVSPPDEILWKLACMFYKCTFHTCEVLLDKGSHVRHVVCHSPIAGTIHHQVIPSQHLHAMPRGMKRCITIPQRPPFGRASWGT